jgi:transposase
MWPGAEEPREAERPAEAEPPKREPRLRRVNREQMLLRPTDVEQLIAEDHPARAIWEFVGRLDLSPYYAGIKAVEGVAGQPALDPQLLISLWVYAYSEGVNSAREVSRLCEYHPAYQWLTGLDPVNHHDLSDFRVDHREALNELFTQVLGLLSAEGLISLERVMHDGTKVKACAGADTFRREETLQAHLAAARERVEQMGDPQNEEVSPRLAKARERAARERKQRLELALQEMEKLRGTAGDAAAKQPTAGESKPSSEPRARTPEKEGSQEEPKEEKKKAPPPRVSETDPEARIMKQSDGGFAPSYNVQISTDAAHGILVGVDVSQAGSDYQQLVPGVEKVEENMEQLPEQVVADGGFTSRENILQMEEKKVDFIGSLGDGSSQSAGQLERRGIDPAFHPEAFTYHPESDTYTCPAGKVLPHQGKEKRIGVVHHQYRALAADCAACPLKAKCCPKTAHGRMIVRNEEAPAVAAFRAKMQTQQAKEIYRQRGAVAEFPNAWIKDKLGLRQFRCRGRTKVTMEALWACLTYNIQQWIRLRWREPVTAGQA